MVQAIIALRKAVLDLTQVVLELAEKVAALEKDSHPPQEVVSGREFDIFKDEIQHRLDVLEGQDD